MGCYIIAEAGTSHGGNLSKAKEIIGQAAEAGADGVKFQIVLAREIIHPLTGEVPLPGGNIPLYQRFEQLEQSLEFYMDLKNLCQKSSVDFLATPFGLESAEWLKELDPPFIKMASPELNHFPLLDELSRWNKPLFLSTGVSKLKDIEEALEHCHPAEVYLLHCITSYPAPEEEYNLSLLPLYEKIFQCKTGVSDHSEHPLLVPLCALQQGAEVLEKHICLKKDDKGLDDPFALTPQEFKIMTTLMKQREKLDSNEQLSELHKEWGKDRIQKILGTGRKVLAPSEEQNYGLSNRSLHALKELSPGEPLTHMNCALLRSEKILRPGIHPRYYEKVLGMTLQKKVLSGEGIRWEDLLTPAPEGILPVN